MSLNFFNTQLAQSVERTPFKRVVEGSSPSLGEGLVDTLKSLLWKWRDINNKRWEEAYFKYKPKYVLKLLCSCSSVG